MADQFDSFEERLARAHPIGDLGSRAKNEFERLSELEKTSDGRRRYDLEKYALVALAIGRYPKNPPEWALQECSKLHQREAEMHGSMLDKQPLDNRRAWVEDVIQKIITEIPGGISALIYEDENGQEFIPEDVTSAVFREARPGIDGSTSVRFATVAKMVVAEKRNQSIEDILATNADKNYLQTYWRNLSDADRYNIISREIRKHLLAGGHNN